MSDVEWIETNKLQSGKDMFITVNPLPKSKRLYINSVATNYIGHDTNWVKVGIIRDKNLLVMQPLDERENSAIKVSNGSSSTGNSKLILNSKLIDLIKNVTSINKTTRFPADWNKQEYFLEIDLSNPQSSKFQDVATDFSKTSFAS